MSIWHQQARTGPIGLPGILGEMHVVPSSDRTL